MAQVNGSIFAKVSELSMSDKNLMTIPFLSIVSRHVRVKLNDNLFPKQHS